MVQRRNSQRVHILAIDGGGIRGIIPAMVLAELERRTGQPVCRLFDLIAGTSTGAILALALAKPGPDGQPHYSAEQMVRFYETEGPRIFRRPLLARLFAARWLAEEKYPAAGLEAALGRCFGETPLRQALCDVVVTSYETERRFPFFFKSRHARLRPDYDFPMRLVARAACAAPTYFEPLRLFTDGPREYYSLIDGGVYANNPALCAYAEARVAWPECGEVLLVSLGTGELTQPLLYSQARRWGLAGWARRILQVVQDGVSATVDYQLQQLLPAPAGGPQRYWRFQVRLKRGNEPLDNVQPENLRELKLLAEALIRDRTAELGHLCRTLASGS
jgi:predicted acylesterase/phospholipase RssA